LQFRLGGGKDAEILDAHAWVHAIPGLVALDLAGAVEGANERERFRGAVAVVNTELIEGLLAAQKAGTHPVHDLLHADRARDGAVGIDAAVEGTGRVDAFETPRALGVERAARLFGQLTDAAHFAAVDEAAKPGPAIAGLDAHAPARAISTPEGKGAVGVDLAALADHGIHPRGARGGEPEERGERDECRFHHVTISGVSLVWLVGAPNS
jgi:hypothetical protein